MWIVALDEDHRPLGRTNITNTLFRITDDTTFCNEEEILIKIEVTSQPHLLRWENDNGNALVILKMKGNHIVEKGNNISFSKGYLTFTVEVAVLQ